MRNRLTHTAAWATWPADEVAGEIVSNHFPRALHEEVADVTFPPCPPGAPGLADVCVRVDVFRNQRAGGEFATQFDSGAKREPRRLVLATSPKNLARRGVPWAS